MTLSIRKNFAQDDEFLTTDWNILAGLAEIVDHAVFVSDSSPSYSQAVYSYATNLDATEQLVRARVQFSGTAGDPYIGLLVRAEREGNSLLRAYLVTLRHDGVLSIYSVLGASTTLISTSTITLPDQDSHNFIVKVRDYEYGAEILVFINDEVTPKITYSDCNTQRPFGNEVGFDLFDGTGHHQVSLTEFFAHVLRSSVIRNPQPAPRLRNYGDLVTEACFRLDRAGNSQFQAEAMGKFVNDSLSELYNRLTPAPWFRRNMTFTTTDGVADYELPAYVGTIYDIRDMSVGRPLTKKNLQWINRTDPLREFTGTPYRYDERGDGDLGGTIITLNPCPSGETVIIVDYYWRPIPMVEYTDIPVFPPEHLEAVILGALKRGAMYDTSQKFFQQAHIAWREALANLMEAKRRDMKDMERLMTDVETYRSETVSGLGPVTRAEQLQL